MSDIISAKEALDTLTRGQSSWLDVRSEGEFASACVPGFRNTPILTNQERHEVGLCYRQKGQEAAIALGHRLVDPVREERVDAWLRHCSEDKAIAVACWRGGLRSQIASAWMRERGRAVQRIQGGYKALRQELLAQLESKRSFLVLTGFTGSGKSRLLQELPSSLVLDLETFAQHRGSSFGAMPEHPQPTQTNFENQIALHLRSCHESPLIEDESRVVGSLHLPEAIFTGLAQSPVIRLHVSLEERCQNIYQEYVAQRLAAGIDPLALREELIQSTMKLKNRLGGLLSSQIKSGIEQAFATQDPTAHELWIGLLLRQYYDVSYQHAEGRSQRPILFEGNYKECLVWIQNRFASQKL